MNNNDKIEKAMDAASKIDTQEFMKGLSEIVNDAQKVRNGKSAMEKASAAKEVAEDAQNIAGTVIKGSR